MNTLQLEHEIVAATIRYHVAKLRDGFLMQIETLKAQRIAEQYTNQMDEFLAAVALACDTDAAIAIVADDVDITSAINELTESCNQLIDNDLHRWLKNQPAEIVYVSEPETVGEATDAVYGTQDLTAAQQDYAEWERDTRNTRASDYPM